MGGLKPDHWFFARHHQFGDSAAKPGLGRPGTTAASRLFVQTTVSDNHPARPEFEDLVNQHYSDLYRFAFSLSRSDADASDLTQQTFYLWATKGGQLRDGSKVRAWLFTTLNRAFLQQRRRRTRFPHFELSEVDSQLPEVCPDQVAQSDWAQVLHALAQVDQRYRAPLALFYLSDRPYQEIAEILNIPLGTVKSRISRGIAQIQQYLQDGLPGASEEIDRRGRPTSERNEFTLIEQLCCVPG